MQNEIKSRKTTTEASWFNQENKENTRLMISKNQLKYR
jgi:hypothetical protein